MPTGGQGWEACVQGQGPACHSWRVAWSEWSQEESGPHGHLPGFGSRLPQEARKRAELAAGQTPQGTL